jgi:EmrB/QacA subfamily drug resistance transporter
VGGRRAPLSRGSLRLWLESTPPGYPHSIGRILAIYSGLMVTIMMASLDQTIVATALPHIVADLGGLGSYSWVFTAFLLGQTISVPIYGKLGDIYGRRPVILTAIGIFLVSSACCGAAQSMTELVIFRGAQGIGAGGLIPLALATIGELVPPRDRGRYQGLISGAFAAAAVMGPAAGGLIVDNTTWRWIFYINLPVGGVALLVIALTMPKRTQRREHSIDFLGAGLLAGGTGAFLAGLVWGGETYPWGSTEVIGALAAAVVLLAAFAVVERRAREPILPLSLLRKPIVATGAASMFLAAMCMFGTIAFVPLFVQGVIGASATSSGIVLTPFTLGAVAATILSGQWVSRTGRYRSVALCGPVMLGIGMMLLWRMGVSTTSAETARDMVIAGVGMGLMMQIFIVAAQNAVPVSEIGTTTALLQFWRAIGTTLGVTLFGVIINHNLPNGIGSGGAIAHKLAEPARSQLANALHPAFLVALCACVGVFALVFFGLKDHSLRASFDEPAGDEPEVSGASLLVPGEKTG